ncbi:site-specific integrase [Carboxylicivirga sp. M1479]|uniref:site-specific integrase n=1 Tax=Carboxylicivirga sp. M1479 TaxID=2594476 RepID=UPI0011787373|nr:site-specific integrase [Carboxylicivirga sp. M1479]TRX70397.1 site-specific integrase [Carboxylicivirga sp. M1479]
MINQQTFAILFFYRSKRKSKTSGTIYIRITANGLRSDFTSNLKTLKSEWDPKKGHFKGSSIKAKTNNFMLEQIKTKLMCIYQEIRLEEDFILPAMIQRKFMGTDDKQHSLLSLIAYHYDTQKNTLEIGTLKHYKTTKKYLVAFLFELNKSNDIYLKKIDYRFITDFEAFLRKYQPPEQAIRKLAHNSIMKHLARLRTLINLAIKLEWIENDPFKFYKICYKKSKRTFLSKDELFKIETKNFSFERLQIVKDLFLFSCYTGLAYSDIKALTTNNIIIGIDGNQWIHSSRKKTDSLLQIPLLPLATELLQKYKHHPISELKNKLFPVPSNQKLNAYLKELADICEINKNLTFHMARHTFATTVTLSNGVPIETVSKVLGHNKISTTQIYAKVLENKIGEDMNTLRNKLNTDTYETTMANSIMKSS